MAGGRLPLSRPSAQCDVSVMRIAGRGRYGAALCSVLIRCDLECALRHASAVICASTAETIIADYTATAGGVAIAIGLPSTRRRADERTCRLTLQPPRLQLS